MLRKKIGTFWWLLFSIRTTRTLLVGVEVIRTFIREVEAEDATILTEGLTVEDQVIVTIMVAATFYQNNVSFFVKGTITIFFEILNSHAVPSVIAPSLSLALNLNQEHKK